MGRRDVSDTDVEARRVMAAVARALGPERRVELALEMSDDVRTVTLEGLRERNPGLTEEELVRLLIGLWHGDALVAQIDASSTSQIR